MHTQQPPPMPSLRPDVRALGAAHTRMLHTHVSQQHDSMHAHGYPFSGAPGMHHSMPMMDAQPHTFTCEGQEETYTAQGHVASSNAHAIAHTRAPQPPAYPVSTPLCWLRAISQHQCKHPLSRSLTGERRTQFPPKVRTWLGHRTTRKTRTQRGVYLYTRPCHAPRGTLRAEGRTQGVSPHNHPCHAHPGFSREKVRTQRVSPHTRPCRAPLGTSQEKARTQWVSPYNHMSRAPWDTSGEGAHIGAINPQPPMSRASWDTSDEGAHTARGVPPHAAMSHVPWETSGRGAYTGRVLQHRPIPETHLGTSVDTHTTQHAGTPSATTSTAVTPAQHQPQRPPTQPLTEDQRLLRALVLDLVAAWMAGGVETETSEGEERKKEGLPAQAGIQHGLGGLNSRALWKSAQGMD